MRRDLEALGLSVAERPVRDLWPRRLLRERAGEKPPSVAVVRPADYEQVARLLAWASEQGVRIVPMGGASAVTGSLSPEAGEVALDLRAFDRILEIDERNLLLHVQAGALGLDVERRLNERGLTLGHQPSSLPVATVGGLIATRSSGQESSRYGSIEDLLLGVTAVLADGTLLRPRPGPRSAVGPALEHLLVGAEGGLAVVLDAVFRVHRQPAMTVGKGYLFADVGQGLEAMRAIMQAGLRPLVMRLYDPEDTMLQGLAEGGCLLVVATAGETGVAEAEAAVVARLVAGARDLGAEPWERWLRHRYDLSAQRLLDLMEPAGAFVDTIEIAATWTAVGAVYAEIKAALSARALALCHFSHAYEQGVCAYFTFAGSAETEAEAEAAYSGAWREAMEATLRGGATISHHHGVGRLRAEWARKEMGEWWKVWEAVRGALDPRGVLNPDALGGRRT
jgi:alkyldihydroxyacetonephosphate synthase